MRWIGVLNLLLGVMAAFSAVLSLLIVSLNATPQPTRLMTCALLLTAVAVSGIISGWKLGQGQRQRQGSLIVTFAFGLLLVIFAAADMIMERSFSVRLALLAIYGGINCVAVTMLNRISSESRQPTRS